MSVCARLMFLTISTKKKKTCGICSCAPHLISSAVFFRDTRRQDGGRYPFVHPAAHRIRARQERGLPFSGASQSLPSPPRPLTRHPPPSPYPIPFSQYSVLAGLAGLFTRYAPDGKKSPARVFPAPAVAKSVMWAYSQVLPVAPRIYLHGEGIGTKGGGRERGGLNLLFSLTNPVGLFVFSCTCIQPGRR